MLDRLLQLCDMGEFNVYVWTAFAITGLVFLINIVLSLREAKQVKKRIERTRYE